jgi:uncharacterized membrane protein YoaK (UPF0700 family)
LSFLAMADKSRPLHSPRFALALALAALAGWVDAVAFVRLAGTFVSFMSGNSTALAAALNGAHAREATLLLCVLASFVAGVVFGEVIAIAAGRRGPAAALLAESRFLFAALVAAFPSAAILAPAVLLAVALGIQNASIHEAAGMPVALTYVTGTLVRLGRAIAAALAGQGAWRAALPFLCLWLALMAGAAGGAMLARMNAVLALALAAATALALAAVVDRTPQH